MEVFKRSIPEPTEKIDIIFVITIFNCWILLGLITVRYISFNPNRCNDFHLFHTNKETVQFQFMRYDITYLLFKLKVIQPSRTAIRFWVRNEHIDRLEGALKHGNYRTRQYAAEALGIIGCYSSVPVLLNAINDNIQNVSIAALNALEDIGYGDELSPFIVKKRLNWLKTKRDKDNKRAANKGKKHTIYRWERASKKSFDIVKERLKRPIR